MHSSKLAAVKAEFCRPGSSLGARPRLDPRHPNFALQPTQVAAGLAPLAARGGAVGKFPTKFERLQSFAG